MSSRDDILQKLRSARRPFPEASPPPETYLPMDTATYANNEERLARFVVESEKLGTVVHLPTSPSDAIETALDLLGDDERVMAWATEHIPLDGLHDALHKQGIAVVEQDTNTRVGITGAEAALAATGSLVLSSGAGKPRAASLLGDVHVAVITRDQLLDGMEAWAAQQKDTWAEASNRVIITGASRTADIGLELVIGAHGPVELHVIIV